MVPGKSDVLYRIGDGGGPGRGGERGDAPFQRADPLLEHGGGGIHEPRVDVPGLGEGEPSGRLGGILEHVGGGHVYRDCARIGRRVRILLSSMDLQGL